jgi:small subunit ribosomal protein S6
LYWTQAEIEQTIEPFVGWFVCEGENVLAVNTYECLFLLDSNRYAKDPGGVSGSLPEMIQKFEGEVLASRLWNEQKLSYQIEGHKKGTYWLTYFKMDGQRMPELNRACQLNGAVLRHLVQKLDNRIAMHMVAAARGESVPVAEEAGAKTTEKDSSPDNSPKDTSPPPETGK